MNWIDLGIGLASGAALYYVYDRYIGTVKSKIMGLEARLAKLKAAL
jgi:hypothetical protein